MKELNIIVLDAASIGDDINYKMFENYGKVTIYPATSFEEFKERAKDADVIIQNKFALKKESLVYAPNLKIVLEAATGYDNIDIEYCREHGIAVTNVPGYSTDSVAQLTFAMVLQIIMRMPEYTSYVSSGAYSASGIANKLDPPIHELRGKTWGIIGYGNIGKKVADIARVFGCRIIANKRTPVPEVECVDVDTICKEADIISLHTPLNDGTRGLIGEKQLALMKSDAILINVARGAVVDEAAVAKAVLDGKLGGFGCDVYSEEPFGAEHPYASIANMSGVCLTPHVAWGAYETRVRLLNEMADNLGAFIRGDIRNRVEIK